MLQNILNNGNKIWYKFFFTEKDVENKAIRDGKLDDEILANKIYQYCKENYITKQTKEKIFNVIADGDIYNGDDALFVLEERGLAKRNNSETECYYEFFLDEEKIKLAKEKLKIVNGELTNEELANKIYKFCKENCITYIEGDELDILIAGENIYRYRYDALKILEERGLVKHDYKDENGKSKLYYTFYIDESGMNENKNNKFIRDGGLDDETLANKLYQYCKENNIFYIKIEDLYSAIADGWIVNGKRALWVLEQKGLAELEFEIKDENSYYKFHYTTEEIEKAKQNPLLNTEYLANKIYQYCKENNITQVSNESMKKTVIGGHVDNYEQAFIILQKKGLLEIVEIENEDDIFDIKFEYKFYFTEKEIQELKDRTLCIMDEELADKIYQYCKENKITSIYNYELEEAFSNGYIIPNFYEAINILINRKKVKDDVGLFIINI
ncbi:MAG: hypothetical protein IJW20_07610 [Clostridia bacterium]|nr:hypothetical protein [Clostridia bacterium]